LKTEFYGSKETKKRINRRKKKHGDCPYGEWNK
jgi:hypothetical protein